MADKVRARRAMHDLQSLGVRIAIDDFGTGYSSLAYLREFPVNILKIDRSFVAPLGADDRAPWRCSSSILSIAEALSLDVIVEGVEDRASKQSCSSISAVLSPRASISNGPKRPTISPARPSCGRVACPCEMTRGARASSLSSRVLRPPALKSAKADLSWL